MFSTLGRLYLFSPVTTLLQNQLYNSNYTENCADKSVSSGIDTLSQCVDE